MKVHFKRLESSVNSNIRSDKLLFAAIYNPHSYAYRKTNTSYIRENFIRFLKDIVVFYMNVKGQ